MKQVEKGKRNRTVGSADSLRYRSEPGSETRIWIQAVYWRSHVRKYQQRSGDMRQGWEEKCVTMPNK